VAFTHQNAQKKAFFEIIHACSRHSTGSLFHRQVPRETLATFLCVPETLKRAVLKLFHRQVSRETLVVSLETVGRSPLHLAIHNQRAAGLSS